MRYKEEEEVEEEKNETLVVSKNTFDKKEVLVEKNPPPRKTHSPGQLTFTFPPPETVEKHSCPHNSLISPPHSTPPRHAPQPTRHAPRQTRQASVDAAASSLPSLTVGVVVSLATAGTVRKAADVVFA